MFRSEHVAGGFSAKPIRQKRAFEAVIIQIRQAVIERRLAVGDHLPHERELAALFEVSRQSVREGLRMLEAFGVLSARRGVGPDSGWVVSANGTSGLSVLLDLYTSLQRTPVWDLLEIREALEILSVRSAAARATAEQGAELVAEAKSMETVTEPQAFLQVDTEFHVSIARKSGNRLAPMFMEAIRDAMSRLMLSAFDALPDWPKEQQLLAAEHVDLANLIRAGDGEAAVGATRRHIRGFYARALEHMVEREPEAAANLEDRVVIPT
jgi:GntR family transcriptional repressor for pyruvate dehydrogenase complex